MSRRKRKYNRNFSTEKAYHIDAPSGHQYKPVHVSQVATKPPISRILESRISSDFWSRVRPKSNPVASGEGLASNSAGARRETPVALHKPGELMPASTRLSNPQVPWRGPGASENKAVPGEPVSSPGRSTHSAVADPGGNAAQQVFQPSGSSGKPIPVPLRAAVVFDHRLEQKSNQGCGLNRQIANSPSPFLEGSFSNPL